MADKKERPKRYTTPTGIAQYPRLLGEPDTKFSKDGHGTWSVKVKFPSVNEPGVQEMLDRFEGMVEKARTDALADKEYMAALKKKGQKQPKAADRGFFVDEDTGEVTVGFKMKASGVTKDKKPWERRPAVFGRDLQPLDPATKLGSGSKVQVSYTAEPFYSGVGYGVSIKLEAVRVLEVVEWGQGDASSYGFTNDTEDEDGEAQDHSNDNDDQKEDF